CPSSTGGPAPPLRRVPRPPHHPRSPGLHPRSLRARAPAMDCGLATTTRAPARATRPLDPQPVVATHRSPPSVAIDEAAVLPAVVTPPRTTGTTGEPTNTLPPDAGEGQRTRSPATLCWCPAMTSLTPSESVADRRACRKHHHGRSDDTACRKLWAARATPENNRPRPATLP